MVRGYADRDIAGAGGWDETGKYLKPEGNASSIRFALAGSGAVTLLIGTRPGHSDLEPADDAGVFSSGS